MKKIYCKNNSEVCYMLKELSKEGYKWRSGEDLENSAVDLYDFCIFIIDEKRKTVQVNYEEKFYSIEDWNETQFEEGDIVKIIDTVKMYSTAEPYWLIKNIEDKELLIKYAYGENLYSKRIREDSKNLYKVRCVSEGLAYIQRKTFDFDGPCYLIRTEGLKKL